jgi:hypothetical protein
MTTVRVNDISMYFEVHGEGESLLMIQGLDFEISHRRIGYARIK